MLSLPFLAFTGATRLKPGEVNSRGEISKGTIKGRRTGGERFVRVARERINNRARGEGGLMKKASMGVIGVIGVA